MVGRLSPRYGTGQETLPGDPELVTLLEVQNWSLDPPGVLELVGRLSQRSGSGREILPEVWTGWETLFEVQKWSGHQPGSPEMVVRPFRRS